MTWHWYTREAYADAFTAAVTALDRWKAGGGTAEDAARALMDLVEALLNGRESDNDR